MQGRIKLDEYVTHTLPIERIDDAFDAMHRGESSRSILRYG